MGSVERPCRDLTRVLVANRGEIAVRLIATCKKLGIRALAVYVVDDADSPHVRAADESFLLEGHGSQGYLSTEEIVRICQRNGVQGVLPGYGFLSENSDFAAALHAAGILFIGPSATTLRDFGLKDRARELAVRAKVPVVPGTPILAGFDQARRAAIEIGYPVMVKATAGGGGMGLQVCRHVDELRRAVDVVKSRGQALFQNDGFFIEKFVESGRHIEAQVFGNGQGDVLFFGERECSVQRRHQKRLESASCALAKSVKYKSAGTIEYLVDDVSGEFYFLEVNTRLQVEHGITELCYDIDLVELMLLQAEEELRGRGGLSAGAMSSFSREGPKGHAIEVRVYAENPAKNYQPAPGLFQNVHFPTGQGIRTDTWIGTGSFVSSLFDPLLAKVLVHSQNRDHAVEKMVATLTQTKLQGPPTNLDFLIQVLNCGDFVTGRTTTDLLDTRFEYKASAIEILEPGTATTVQDWPGRVGVPNGVPTAGPMDSLSFRAANILVGNEEGVEGLEITLLGPKIKFHAGAVIALCDWPNSRGSTRVSSIRGGLPNVATYLGSKSTTPSLEWGGYQGRRLLAGDFLFIDSGVATSAPPRPFELDRSAIPEFSHEWQIAALPGPWFSNEFLTTKGQEHLYTATYKVSYNSSRTGIRLEGPPPTWGRRDGGEGGSHPSNMVGFGCTVGSVSFTGDSGIILPVDGPNQTGFIVTQVVGGSDLWKLGQLRPGDSLTFVPATWAQTLLQEQKLGEFVSSIRSQVKSGVARKTEEALIAGLLCPQRPTKYGDGILATVQGEKDRPRVVLRQAGERAISCLFGPGTFDLGIRARIQHVANTIRNDPPLGLGKHPVAENCSLLVHFDPHQTTQDTVVQTILALNKAVPDVRASRIPSRIIHLPGVFDAKECQETNERYMLSQRSKAAYLPDSIDFIRRSNGLKTREQVKESYFEIPLLINAVGWMMGLPIYVQVDPRRRLVVPKTNPSRTFTKAGCLGTGGGTSSIYPNDSPGGYQLWGATIPGICWDTYGQKPGFTPERPWLFEAFDQVIFHSVNRAEFDAAINAFKAGRYHIQIEQSDFDMAAYNALIEQTREEVARMKKVQEECTERELALERVLFAEWKADVDRAAEAKEKEKKCRASMVPDAALVEVPATMISSVWKVEVSVGDIIPANRTVVVLEAMKMEIAVHAPSGAAEYKVANISREPGERVETGDVLVLLQKLP
ncbi:Biotin carboxylase domain-containing protein [Cladophialophora immunda]|nr:Biotin carboxylase domain-containing protein [Cladophialophora immunda]